MINKETVTNAVLFFISETPPENRVDLCLHLISSLTGIISAYQGSDETFTLIHALINNLADYEDKS